MPPVDEEQVLKNPSLMATVPGLNGNNVGEFFRVLEEIAVLGKWSKPQLAVITKLKLEGRARGFYDASLRDQVLDYDSLKVKFVRHFDSGQSFATNFSRFASAFQLEGERVRDFASRIEGLALKSFKDNEDGNNSMPKELNEKILLSQFITGLKPTIRAQILITDPTKFQEAAELADRIERSQNMLTPNINVVSNIPSIESSMERLVKSSSESYEKTIELLSKQFERINERLEKLENAGEKRENNRTNLSSREFSGPLMRCFYCNMPGHYERECRKKMAEGQYFRRSSGRGSWGDKRSANGSSNFRNI